MVFAGRFVGSVVVAAGGSALHTSTAVRAATLARLCRCDGDKVDLDELFRDAKPVGDVGDWAIPGFFADEEEFGEFQAWLKAERASGLA